MLFLRAAIEVPDANHDASVASPSCKDLNTSAMKMKPNSLVQNRGSPTNVKVPPREELVLYALYGKELYGLQIPQVIEEASEHTQNMGMGTLYPTLHSLEKKGLIESRWGDERREERGGARRRYYKLTDSGNTTLRDIQFFRSNLLSWQPS